MSSGITIAFDVMGGDQGSRPCVSASEIFSQRYPEAQILLFGDETLIRSQLTAELSNIKIVDAPTVVSMYDQPAKVVREKSNSSMQLSLQALADNKADACVSCGNTGALMALSRHTLNMLDGVKRPAICKEIPTTKGRSFLLDLGANINCNALHLVQFAAMGCALAKVNGADKPKVALLNVGSEITKGTETVKSAATALSSRQSKFDFVGFIEGDELYSGKVDVIVCDGFVGNVALKVSEGLVKYLLESLNAFFNGSVFGRLSKLLVGPLLMSWSRKKNPSLYNGAAFLGLNKTVIKSHGSADIIGLVSALEAARDQVLADIPYKINQELSAM